MQRLGLPTVRHWDVWCASNYQVSNVWCIDIGEPLRVFCPGERLGLPTVTSIHVQEAEGENKNFDVPLMKPFPTPPDP